MGSLTCSRVPSACPQRFPVTVLLPTASEMLGFLLWTRQAAHEVLLPNSPLKRDASGSFKVLRLLAPVSEVEQRRVDAAAIGLRPVPLPCQLGFKPSELPSSIMVTHVET